MSAAGDSGAGASRARPKVAPKKNVARRSKEERDKLEAEENERRRARAEAHAAEEAAEVARRQAQYGILKDSNRGGRKWDEKGRFGDRRGRGGRGGFMGDRGRGGRFGGERGGHHTVKTEPRVKQDPDGDVGMDEGPGVMTEPGDTTGRFLEDSSDDEADRNWKNIEDLKPRAIVISDDEDDYSDSRSVNSMLPIRLDRRDHVDRVIGINTEASSEKSAEMLRQAEQGKADLSLSAVTDAALGAPSTSPTARKTKPRGKDVEFLGGNRKWKGVYDSSDDESALPRIKTEPVEDPSANILLDSDPEDAPHPVFDPTNPAPEATMAVAAEPVSPTLEQKAHIKTKLRDRRKSSAASKKPPVFQTDEERREHDMHNNDLRELYKELGTVSLAARPNALGDDTEMADATDAAAAGTTQDQRTDRVYLFQLPPVIPNLLPSDPANTITAAANAPTTSVKPEPHSPTLTRASPTSASVPAPDTTSTSTATTAPPSTTIKPDPDSKPTTPSTNNGRAALFASGRAGKLRVHRSGRATLDWGGVALELGMGVQAYFLQSAYLTRLEGAGGEGEAGEGFGGEAMSFGQIRGKFVVRPDWSEIVENW